MALLCAERLDWYVVNAAALPGSTSQHGCEHLCVGFPCFEICFEFELQLFPSLPQIFEGSWSIGDATGRSEDWPLQ